MSTNEFDVLYGSSLVSDLTRFALHHGSHRDGAESRSADSGTGHTQLVESLLERVLNRMDERTDDNTHSSQEDYADAIQSVEAEFVCAESAYSPGLLYDLPGF